MLDDLVFCAQKCGSYTNFHSAEWGRPTRGIRRATPFSRSAAKSNFWPFPLYLQYIAVQKNTLKKHGNTHLQYNYIL